MNADPVSAFFLVFGALIGIPDKPMLATPRNCRPEVRLEKRICPRIPMRCREFGWYQAKDCSVVWVEIMP